ncbi:hypothetical protein [Clavibacter michiganensis]|uniref:Secreted protein n=1 Tax=Clavibacter michiganensis subsp. insidiosus TaxID=33014 RepID=A0A0D5CM30_9MICO|nr:hypothetical protein [Clavibacter michiganensis]AJW80696.1 hypothetical protein VO01_15770 [Clavibacter michiganensis subsp. insidiosus]AWF99893.1 hypothetical protein BEH61_15410 [Clavibacter michiganensis subsp. insidiosus]
MTAPLPLSAMSTVPVRRARHALAVLGALCLIAVAPLTVAPAANAADTTTASVTTVSAAPAPPLEASAINLGPYQNSYSGLRVCGWYNSNSRSQKEDPEWIGSGLAVVVRKDGGSTCDAKLDYMRKYYGSAFSGSTAVHSYRMITCEDFARLTNYETDPKKQVSPCDEMMSSVNGIYRIFSFWDAVHPQARTSVQFWHW